jgi:DNA-binding transcriptional LysR family regulator
MDLNLLTVFESVARSKSFSAAAKELGLPKSTVSRGIARLESDLGVQLLLRTTRQVSLTPEGTDLFDRVTPILRSMKDALGAVPERGEAPSGTLRVTAPPDIGLYFLAEMATRFTARYPGVSIDVNLSGRVVDLVGEGFDVALRVADRLEDSSLVARKVATLTLHLFASPLYLARRGTPRSEDDLADHDWVSFRGGPEKLRPRNVRFPRPARAARVVCDDLLFLRDAVKAGAGVGLLPTFIVEADVLAGRLVRIVPRYERTAGVLHFVTPAAKHVPARVAAFRDLVLEMLRVSPAMAGRA